MSEALSYPVGRFNRSAVLTPDMRPAAIEVIAALPSQLRFAVAGLTDDQLAVPYRPDGWTVRQLVHHVADSHLNGYVRLKLAVTEETPTIKPYDQDRWAELPDSSLPIDISLNLTEAVHERWTAVWRSLRSEDYSRAFIHPELGPLTIDTHLHLYAWHSRHHVAHISGLRARNGW
jgi:hypothetical protein